MNADWAWAAGFFEGEGSITIRKRRGRPTDAKEYGQVSLQLANTDLDVLERFARVVGHGNIHEQRLRDCHRKVQYRWSTAKRSEVRRILLQMRPWLGRRRGAKADEILAFIRAKDGHPPLCEEPLTTHTRASAAA